MFFINFSYFGIRVFFVRVLGELFINNAHNKTTKWNTLFDRKEQRGEGRKREKATTGNTRYYPTACNAARMNGRNCMCCVVLYRRVNTIQCMCVQ